MTQGRGQGRVDHASKILVRGRGSISRVNMPTVPISRTNSQLGGVSSCGGPDHINQVQIVAPTSLPPVQTSGHDSNLFVHSESTSTTPNQTNTGCEGPSTQRNIIGESISSQSNTISEGESNSNPAQQTLVFLTPSGLEPSNYCSNYIYESFKSELDPKESIGKKAFYWDPSINSEVKIQWRRKAARGLLKRVEIQHQASCIYTSIHTDMMENLLLVSEHELCMRKIKKYCRTKKKLNVMLINFKHIIKLREEKKKEEYMVLDLKQNYFMGQIFMPLLDLVLQSQYHLRMLK